MGAQLLENIIVDPLDNSTWESRRIKMRTLTWDSSVVLLSLRGAFQKKISQIVEKVHNFLDPTPLG